MKLSRCQHIVTDFINYSPYMDNMSSLENFVYTIFRQLINVIYLTNIYRN